MTRAKLEPARILVFDSGLGGLTVFRDIRRLRPEARYTYCADDAVFPYGELAPDVVIARVADVLAAQFAISQPHVVVIACNTASTLVLGPLRARWPDIPFVGTVPAIKPAAEASHSRMISVLATPGTVARDYTAALVRDFGSDCAVNLVGSARLAPLAEAVLRGRKVADAEIVAEISPAFVTGPQGRTDVVVLACTHYPLLMAQLRRLAPWEVNWIDPAPAIARRVDHLLTKAGFAAGGPASGLGKACFTSGAEPNAALTAALAAYGLHRVEWSLAPTSINA
ncbi:MAG: glutamate racemase [Hyphomicrobiales bacterium]|nr:glutamate racemase [Hyphomicrobiales bacterium]